MRVSIDEFAGGMGLVTRRRTASSHCLTSWFQSENFRLALLEVFPTLRVIRQDYDEHWIDRVTGPSEDDPEWLDILSETMRAPHGDPMPYVSNFADVDSGWYRIWVEPAGWKPQWSRRAYRQGRYVLLNEPPLQFEFLTSWYHIYGPDAEQRDCVDNTPATLADDEVCVIDSGRIMARYIDDDREQQRFLRVVWRILRKQLTNQVARIDRGGAIVKVWGTGFGLDAVAWTRIDRRHRIEFIKGFRAADAFGDAKDSR